MKTYGKHQDGLFVIGDGVGIVGRWSRLFFGLNSIIYFVLNPILLNPIPKEDLAGFALERGLALAGVIVLYIVVFHFFGRLLFARLTPWAGTAVFLGLPSLLFVLGIMPGWAGMAFGMYIGVSLILTFFMKYGGCEVVALPSMLLGKRYTMYCPLNAIDVVERAVTPDAYSKSHKFFMITSLGITSLVGGYFFILRGGNAFSRYGYVFELDYRFSWLLIIPFFYATYMVWENFKKEKKLFAPPVRKFGMGAIILFLMLVNFGVPDIQVRFWNWFMIGGTVYVFIEIGLIMLGKKKLREA